MIKSGVIDTFTKVITDNNNTMLKSMLTILFLTLMTPVFSNTDTDIEKKLVTSFKRIDYWYERQQTEPKAEFGDSLVKANQNFQLLLVKYAENPSTLAADFKTLKESGVTIATAEDGMFRIYSWDTELGGTMHIFYNVCQYKSGTKVYSKIISDGKFEAGRWFSDIYTHQVSGKKYYLGIAHSIYSGKDNSQEIRVFGVSEGMLNDKVKLIKTRSGLTNKLRVDFDFFSVYRRPERPVKLITYDKNTEVITIPLVDQKYQVTDKVITYRFDGRYFVRN